MRRHGQQGTQLLLWHSNRGPLRFAILAHLTGFQRRQRCKGRHQLTCQARGCRRCHVHRVLQKTQQIRPCRRLLMRWRLLLLPRRWHLPPPQRQ